MESFSGGRKVCVCVESHPLPTAPRASGNPSLNTALKYLFGLSPISGWLGTEGQSLARVHMLFLDSLGYDHQSVSRSVHSHDPGSTALLFLGVLLITPHNVLSGTLLSITLIISHVHSELWTMLGFLFPIGYQKAHCLMGLPFGR